MSAPIILMLGLGWAATSSSAASVVDDIVEGRAELPSLREVQRAAVEALILASDSEASAWASRARWRGLMPRVDARVATDDNVGVRSALATLDGAITSEAQQLGIDVGVRFELGELVFSDLELRANREALARAAAIQLARDRATQIYFDRVEVLLQLRKSTALSLQLSAARLDGLLDSITGGRLKRPRKDQSP